MTTFKIYTAGNAPEKSRPILKDVQDKLGFVPNIVGAMAESPATLRAWTDVKGIIETGQLSPIERKIVGMTTSYLNNCGYCIAAGTTIAEKEGLPKDVIEALRADRALKDAKLEQLRLFTKAVLKRLGRPEKADIDAFRKAGYTNAHVLEVVLGVTHSILGNYINHIAEAPLDKAFEANRFETGKRTARKSDAA
jgi:uncharacterized peroxidase-related enzyme